MALFDLANKGGDLADKVTQVLTAAGVDVEGLKVEESDGVITLNGKAASADARDKAVQLAKEVEGVTSVSDNLEVPASSKSSKNT